MSKEYDAIKSACDEEVRAREKVGDQWIVVKVFSNASVRRAVIIGCALRIFQQTTGINTVMYVCYVI